MSRPTYLAHTIVCTVIRPGNQCAEARAAALITMPVSQRNDPISFTRMDCSDDGQSHHRHGLPRIHRRDRCRRLAAPRRCALSRYEI